MNRYKFKFVNPEFKKSHYSCNPDGTMMNFLTYIQEGMCEITAGNRKISAKAGEVFLLPKGVSYSALWSGADKISYRSYAFAELHIAESVPFALQKINCDSALIQRIKEIPTEGSFVSCKALGQFYTVMADLIPLMKPAENKDAQIVERARQYIYDHLNCTMAELASGCFISESYLYKIFKRYAQISPNEFKAKILCEIGAELLATTDKTVEEIAAIIGFSSGSYFRKLLKAHTEKTPKEIRKECI